MAKAPTAHHRSLYHNIRGSFKKIEDYSAEELDATISVLGCDLPDAYRYLNFVDAYLERRRRKSAERENHLHEIALGDMPGGFHK